MISCGEQTSTHFHDVHPHCMQAGQALIERRVLDDLMLADLLMQAVSQNSEKYNIKYDKLV